MEVESKYQVLDFTRAEQLEAQFMAAVKSNYDLSEFKIKLFGEYNNVESYLTHLGIRTDKEQLLADLKIRMEDLHRIMTELNGFRLWESEPEVYKIFADQYFMIKGLIEKLIYQLEASSMSIEQLQSFRNQLDFQYRLLESSNSHRFYNSDTIASRSCHLERLISGLDRKIARLKDRGVLLELSGAVNDNVTNVSPEDSDPGEES